MTELDGLPEDILAEVLEARAAKAKSEREAAQTTAAVRREYQPMWDRMKNFQRYADEIGVGYTLSLTPRATSSGGRS